MNIEDVLDGATLVDRVVDYKISEKQQALLEKVQAKSSELKS